MYVSAILLLSLVLANGEILREGHARNETARLFGSPEPRKERINSRSMIDRSYPRHPQERMFDNFGWNKSAGGSCARQKTRQCLISMLSKIARVQFADPIREDRDQLMRNTSERSVTDSGAEKLNVARESGEKEKVESSSDDRRNSTEPKRMQRFRCHAIRDVYIPDVKDKVPAYSCKFGDKTFVLSSTRFFEDRRSHLDVNIDEDAFQRLKVVPKVSRGNRFSVIPATLVLKLNTEKQSGSSENKKEEHR